MVEPSLENDHQRERARLTLLVFGMQMIVWIVAWFAKIEIDKRMAPGTHADFEAAYWFSAKLIIWIAPAYWLLRRSGTSFLSSANFPNWPKWVFWGAILGTSIAIPSIGQKMLLGKPWFAPRIGYATLNVLAIAPLFEEFLCRGAILNGLLPAMGFTRANTVAALCFVILHLPGWFFMGNFSGGLIQITGGMIAIFVLGWLFGLATRKGGSFLGGSIAHFLNNLCA